MKTLMLALFGALLMGMPLFAAGNLDPPPPPGIVAATAPICVEVDLALNVYLEWAVLEVRVIRCRMLEYTVCDKTTPSPGPLAAWCVQNSTVWHGPAPDY